jgi:23S rRNA U2552 (ribose-2'-O)-methylase RlmE/FtsJ
LNDTVTDFERRFHSCSPTFQRVLSAKSYFSADPNISAHYDNKREQYIQQTDAMRLASRNEFEQTFGEFNNKVGRGSLFSNDNIGTFLDLGCAPGGFSKFILDNNKGSVGLGITLPDHVGLALSTQGTYLEDKSRYRLELADLTTVDFESIRTTYPLPSGTTTVDGYDFVIAGAFRPVNTIITPNHVTLALMQLYAILYNLRPGGSAVIVVDTKPFLWLIEMFRVLRQVFDSVEAVQGNKHAIRSSAHIVCTGFLFPMSSIEIMPKLRERVTKALEYVGTITAAEGGDGNDATVKKGEELEIQTQYDSVEWYSEPVIFAPEGPDALFDSEHRFILDLMEPLWEAQIDAIVEMKQSSHRNRGGLFRGSFSQPSNSVRHV